MPRGFFHFEPSFKFIFFIYIVTRRDGHSFSCSPKKTNQKKGAAVVMALRVPARIAIFYGATELALRAHTVLATTP